MILHPFPSLVILFLHSSVCPDLNRGINPMWSSCQHLKTVIFFFFTIIRIPWALRWVRSYERDRLYTRPLSNVSRRQLVQCGSSLREEPTFQSDTNAHHFSETSYSESKNDDLREEQPPSSSGDYFSAKNDAWSNANVGLSTTCSSIVFHREQFSIGLPVSVDASFENSFAGEIDHVRFTATRCSSTSVDVRTCASSSDDERVWMLNDDRTEMF